MKRDLVYAIPAGLALAVLIWIAITVVTLALDAGAALEGVR